MSSRQVISGQTRLLGVIGDPIGHTLSPVMHNAAIAELGLDLVYLPFPVAAANLAAALNGFAAIGLLGFSVTIPHKQAIMPLLNEVSAVAQAIGAVNTVCRTAAGWYGTNTDAEGFLAPLLALNRDWQSTTAVILGNGGAARAVVAGCAQLGFSRIQVVGRSSDKLAVLRQGWPDLASLTVHLWEELPLLLPNATLIVNSTPVGMHPQAEASPLSHAEIQQVQPAAIFYDLIYSPRPTQFLQQAAAQGATAIDGLGMLVQQGAVALSLWLEQPVSVAVMRQALLDHFAQKSQQALQSTRNP
ncbi:MAG: shikimate dehydrogenase [Pegethrix bostrychoides GSE-TBD4-15B]|jgi:shikimate dehydrogenase|uniref:Shikimate dehydrogenase (NADP(+)) n=1 Tax=Pegethrix bostrychoides GSE-TBD4-15B TaxID=2839662 RepID=A0A951P9H6_9CYAN|nr:shikimate dehydrogenase [Pegethrix bostrychoides GSE-TBD4-15B]